METFQIRARIERQDGGEELMYPEDDSFAGYSAFFAILQGYRDKGLEIDIELCSEVPDENGVPIYEGDRVSVIYHNELGQEADMTGFVECYDGSFSIFDDEGDFLWWVTSDSVFDGAQLFKITVVEG